MLKDITIGQFYPGRSAVHKLDPRTKLLLTLAMIILIFFIDSYWGYLVLACYLTLATLASQLKPKYILKGLKPLWFIIIFTFVINALFTKGETQLVDWWVFHIYREGLAQAIRMALRLAFLVVGSSVLTLTTSPLQLSAGIEGLLKPLEVVHFPAHELAMMMSIALRFIPIFIEETDKIMKAQKSRGADFESGSLMHRAKSLIPLLIPLFVSAFRRADELAMAMEARCYNGGAGRTKLHELHFGGNDLTAAIISLIFFVPMVLL